MDLNINLNDEKKKKGQKKYRKNSMFSERKEIPATAVISVVIAVAAFLALLILIFLSFLADGKSGIVTGAIGTLMLFAVIGGFITALVSFYHQEVSLKYPFIGVIGNGILLLIYGVIYLSGTGFF